MGSCWRMRPVDRPRARADHQSVIWYWPHLVCSLVLVVPLLFWFFFPLVASPRYANSPASKLLLTASARPCVVNSVRVRQDAVATRTDPDGRPACSAGRWIVQRRPAAQAPKSQNRIDRILQQQQQRPFRCKSRPNFYFPESKFVRSLNSTGGDATVGVRFVRRNLRCALTWAPARAPLAIALRF